MRALARHLEMDPAAMSRTLNGSRRMQLDEASAIANFLAVPVSEVLRHAGVSTDLDGLPTKILLAMAINGEGEMYPLEQPRPLPQSIIDRAQDAIHRYGSGMMVAAQIRAHGGPLLMFDDAILLFKHTAEIERDAIGSLAICRSVRGGQLLCRLQGIRRTGEASIIRVDGDTYEYDVNTATPVLAIIP